MEELEVYDEMLPNSKTVFKRINIILGANGTGKSKLLTALKNKLGYPRGGSPSHRPNGLYCDKTLYIEGGRAVYLDGRLLQQAQGNGSDTLSGCADQYKENMLINLSSRLNWAIRLIEKKSQFLKLEHSDKMAKLANEGYNNGIPKRETPPLDQLFEMFKEIFPSIELSFKEDTRMVVCTKAGVGSYDINNLSDGEKQVLAILADIRLLTTDNSLIIVDEPEVNLHPSLAIKLWETIENDLPSCRFIYSTHSVSFSTRENVDKIIVLSEDPSRSKEIEKISEIDKSDLANLLGSIPAILARANALIVEGKPNSFDTVFYKWIINNKDIDILAMGNCEEVKAVTTRQGVWEAIASNVTIYGIIDRDFKSETELNSSLYHSALAYHEAESYLCDPKVIVAIAAGMSNVDPLPTIEEVRDIILQEFEKQLSHIAAKRVFAKANIKLSVAIPNAILKDINDEQTLKNVLITEAQKEAEKANLKIGPQKVIDLFDVEFEICKKALREKDIDLILSLIPGKELSTILSKKAGCPNVQSLCFAARKHIKIQEFQKLSELRDHLNSIFKRTS